ncbi:MAG: hypothetical protein ABIQ70_12780 [Dokdonella sp.]
MNLRKYFVSARTSFAATAGTFAIALGIPCSAVFLAQLQSNGQLTLAKGYFVVLETFFFGAIGGSLFWLTTVRPIIKRQNK